MPKIQWTNLLPALRDHRFDEVERAFATLKAVIELRPIYHRTVEAHIFVARARRPSRRPSTHSARW